MVKLDLEQLAQECSTLDTFDVEVQSCELAALVKIARAAVLTTKWRQSAPELRLLVEALNEAGLL